MIRFFHYFGNPQASDLFVKNPLNRVYRPEVDVINYLLVYQQKHLTHRYIQAQKENRDYLYLTFPKTLIVDCRHLLPFFIK